MKKNNFSSYLPYYSIPQPKGEVSCTVRSFEMLIKRGWWGQAKIHGHRAQIHLNQESCIVYTRHGVPHKKIPDEKIISEWRRVLPVSSEWSIFDSEWLKEKEEIYVFDTIMLHGKPLNTLSYRERYAYLPQIFQSQNVFVLPVLKTVSECIREVEKTSEDREGLVFRSPDTIGFYGTSIVKCRKK